MKLALTLTSLVAAGATLAFVTNAQSFSLKDPKGVNTMVFMIDSMLEPISGHTAGVSGDITFDPANPAASKGSVVIDANSLAVPNARMSEKMKTDSMWLATDKFPRMTFTIVSVKDVKKKGDAWEVNVVGDFAVKDVTKRITVPATVTHLKDGAGKRMGGATGDLLMIRSNFSFKRSDYNIGVGTPFEIVGDTVEIRFAVAGTEAQ